MRVLKVLVVFVVMTAFTASAFAERGLGGIYTKRNLTQAPSSLKILAGPTALQLDGVGASGLLAEPGFNFRNPETSRTVDVPDGFAPEVESVIGFNLGAVYGITNEIEAGAMFAPLIFAPEGTDLYNNVPVWVTYGMDMGSFDVGFRLTGIIPIVEGSDFALAPGIPFVFRGGGFKLDTGVFVPLNFGDDLVMNLNIPVRAAFQATPNIYAGLTTGLNIGQLVGPEGSESSQSVPLGVFAGYTLLAGGRVIDLALSFTFDNALLLSAEEPVSTTQFSDFRLAVGGNVALKF